MKQIHCVIDSMMEMNIEESTYYLRYTQSQTSIMTNTTHHIYLPSDNTISVITKDYHYAIYTHNIEGIIVAYKSPRRSLEVQQ